MSIDLEKLVARAKKSIERGKLDDAIEAYLEIHGSYPANLDALQTLGDLYARQGNGERSAHFYGLQFDRLVENRDPTKAMALYSRFLKSTTQPPERVARYANLLQKQNRSMEAIEQFENAAELYLFQQRTGEALTCWERIAVLDPDNPGRHFLIGEVAERLGQMDSAARGYLRAGQLTLALNDVDAAISILERANRIQPNDRGIALVYADGILRKGQAQRAVELLGPFVSGSSDTDLQLLMGRAQLEAKQLDKAFATFESLARPSGQHYEKLFEIAQRQLESGDEAGATKSIEKIRSIATASKKEEAFAVAFENLLNSQPKSIPLHEFAGRYYNEINRETKYFGVLTKLFDLYLEKGNIRGACDALDRLVEIDPYDNNHAERLGRLEGKADDSYVRSFRGRLTKTAGAAAPVVTTRTAFDVGDQPAQAPAPSVERGSAATQRTQTLEDMIVQTEIFLQYSLEAKAKERLQKIAEMFAGEEEKNERLRALYEQAKWWPPGSKMQPRAAAASGTSVTMKTGSFNADTLRDLTKMSEVNKVLFRQPTPKAILGAAVNEVGKHLRAARCIATIGPPDQPPQMTGEFTATGVEAMAPPRLAKLLPLVAAETPDTLGAISFEAATNPQFAETGLLSLLAVLLVDKEKQEPGGMLLVATEAGRRWKPNESYFLQAVGDQMLVAVNHARLRTLMRTLAVADEKTGLLSASSYQDCLLAETARAKQQSSPLSLLVLQVDKARELARQFGEDKVEGYIEGLSRTLLTGVRQTDIAVKYAGWAVALVMPDTTGSNALGLADKLRRLAGSVKAPWNGAGVTLSAVVAEAAVQAQYDNEDIVTHLINRVDSALEDVRKGDGSAVVECP
ncbi:MAG TPA: tetratricopeptide repeat protein [Candidatus Acidoferrales bacterium]|nr:tetratricopeptide repeat protein [Candidatus Acidoferrales bacterium]